MSNKEEENSFSLEGDIIKCLPNATFIVKVCKNDFIPKETEILCHVSGKMRKFYIKMTVGDRVKFEVSPYDITKGRITFRHKKNF